MIIRPAILTDLDACVSLDHDYATDYVWHMKVRETDQHVGVTFDTVRLPRTMETSYPRNPEQVAENLQLGGSFFVAEVDGQVRGYIDLLAYRWQRMGWVENLAVDRGFRRRGLGTALLRQALKWARGQGLQSITVEATTKSYPALCLYQKQGFQFCGFNDHYYTNQDIALFFVQTFR
jgi:ribosomal protein S18 acetylase RimI-like enzyme